MTEQTVDTSAVGQPHPGASHLRRWARRGLVVLMVAGSLTVGTIVVPNTAEASNHREATMANCLEFRPTLKQGVQNQTACVKALQDFLNVHKFLRSDPTPIAVDGVFGHQTHQAVRQFQYWSMLVYPDDTPITKVDGVVGPNTWSEINFTCAYWGVIIGPLCHRVVRY